MDEKKTPKAQELADEELERVSGGQTHFATTDGRYFTYIGKSGDDREYLKDFNRRYCCPRCKRPVHYGVGDRYYCDACDESWYYESKLLLNLAGGLYKEVSREEYEREKSWWE